MSFATGVWLLASNSSIVVISFSRGTVSTPWNLGEARNGASRMIGNVRPAPGAVRRGRGGLVRFCAHRCGLVRWGAPNGRIDADAGQAAFRRAKPPDRRNHPRGNRAAPYLPAVAGRAGQAQPVDPGKSAGRPAAVHARDHGAAGAGARRVLAQVASGVRADPCQRRCRPRRSRRLFAPRGHWIEGTYITMRPSFGDKEAIYAYHTEIAWDAAARPCCSGKASGWIRPSASSARSRCPTSPASSIW